MTRTVDDVLRDIHSSLHVTGDALLLEAEILALRAERDAWREGARGVTAELAAVADALGARMDVLECARDIRAERDALRAAVVDTECWSGSGNWHPKHAAVIARAREAAP